MFLIGDRIDLIGGVIFLIGDVIVLMGGITFLIGCIIFLMGDRIFLKGALYFLKGGIIFLIGGALLIAPCVPRHVVVAWHSELIETHKFKCQHLVFRVTAVNLLHSVCSVFGRLALGECWHCGVQEEV
jgi:hypothetical protein